MKIAVNGYFDPFHVGHLEYIKLAKEFCKGKDDKLIVILNNDHQAKLKKGKSFMPVEERKEIIESIRYVDKVVISIDEDETVCKTVELVKPDVFAKGGDRFINEIPEAETCKRLGIKMVDGLGEKKQSSSDLIKKWVKKR